MTIVVETLKPKTGGHDSQRPEHGIDADLSENSVGYSLRLRAMPVLVDSITGDSIRIIYDHDCRRMIVSGPSREVFNHLVKMGYILIDDPRGLPIL